MQRISFGGAEIFFEPLFQIFFELRHFLYFLHKRAPLTIGRAGKWWQMRWVVGAAGEKIVGTFYIYFIFIFVAYFVFNVAVLQMRCRRFDTDQDLYIYIYLKI